MYRYVGYTALLLFSISLCIFCIDRNALAQDDVLAKIGDRKITISDLDKTIGYLDSQKQKIIEQNPQLKEQLLRQLVQSIVISDLAKKDGYDKKPEVVDQLEIFKDSFLANIYLQKEVIEKFTVSEEDMKSYYETHEEEFKKPEMVKARHILIKIDAGASEEEKKKAQEQAGDILKKIKAGDDFAKLASEFSDDNVSKTNGGDLGFFARGSMVKPFEDAAFALKPGEISDIVETRFGYHIIKVDEKKDAEIEPFDTVKERINQKLLQDGTRSKITEFIDKSMEDAGVELHLELITGIKE